jgi:hypothetical protein
MQTNSPISTDSSKTQETEPTTAADGAGARSSSLSEAVSLGWLMAGLYRDATRQPTRKPSLPDTLPSLSRLGDGRRTEFSIAQVEASLLRLGLPGTGAPSTDALNKVFESKESDREEVKREVYRLHLAILRETTAADPALGKAYGLGRALADTCPDAIEKQAMIKQLNRYRLDELGRWLADLSSRLPDHSSRAVRISMTRWKIEAKEGESSPLFAKGDIGQVHRALDRQVQIWRSLLTGEKQAKDMLDTSGYAQAVSFAVRDNRQLVFRYVWSFLPFVTLALAVLAAGIWGLATYEQTSKVIASSVAVAGGLGLSWKGAASTLGRLAGEIEGAIWEGSVDLVVADAITQPPASSVSLSAAAGVSTAAGGTPGAVGPLAGLLGRAPLPPGSDTAAQHVLAPDDEAEDVEREAEDEQEAGDVGDKSDPEDAPEVQPVQV